MHKVSAHFQYHPNTFSILAGLAVLLDALSVLTFYAILGTSTVLTAFPIVFNTVAVLQIIFIFLIVDLSYLNVVYG